MLAPLYLFLGDILILPMHLNLLSHIGGRIGFNHILGQAWTGGVSHCFHDPIMRFKVKRSITIIPSVVVMCHLVEVPSEIDGIELIFIFVLVIPATITYGAGLQYKHLIINR
jgi:hypothetical protein